VFHVRNYPEVAGVFAERIARVLASLGSLEVLLSRIFLGDSYRVKIEHVVVTLCEPWDGFVSARKTLGGRRVWPS